MNYFLDKKTSKLDQCIHSHIATDCGRVCGEMKDALPEDLWKEYESLIRACCGVIIEWRRIKKQHGISDFQTKIER
jgi:hypothetical protein